MHITACNVSFQPYAGVLNMLTVGTTVVICYAMSMKAHNTYAAVYPYQLIKFTRCGDSEEQVLPVLSVMQTGAPRICFTRLLSVANCSKRHVRNNE